jgi:2-dehydro-3-deoxyphosphogluconate aldolase/(4S)-4-hydroxy-2-oxoglutarate aldolase
VFPGLSVDIVKQAAFDDLIYMPRIQTGSEAITGYRHGLRSLKNFPAKTAGGFYRLQQLAPLFPNLKFCPTGGIGFMEAPT